MIKIIILTLTVLVSSGCRSTGSLPVLTSKRQAFLQGRVCVDPYVTGKWEFVHSIEAVFNGHRSFFTGITIISSRNRTMKCAIMTTEGFVLFEAGYDNRGMHVIRAVSPFDSKPFARGLMEDICLIFFRPQGRMIRVGYTKDGSFVCRYTDSDNRTVDIVRRHDVRWEIRQYNEKHELVRIVKPSFINRDCKGQIFPETITLYACGKTDYKLIMHLVGAVEQP